MALNVGTLVAYLKLDTSDVDKGMTDAEKKLRGSSDRLANIWEGAKKATGLLATGLVGLAAAGTGIGLKTAADMEQASISFTTMLGSGEKAQAFLKDLNNFAAKTPFDFPGLQSAASSLISAGIDANKVIPIMTSLGNATSGMGTGAEGVQRATIALQQMSAAGKITGEDLNQLRDAGIPVFDLLAAATGKSKEEVAGLAQAGKLGKKELEQLMSALESGAGLERFSGLMDKQSQSLSGMISTLKDTANMGLARAFEPAIPFLKILLTDANTLLTASLPGITAGVGKITAALAGVYTVLAHGDFDATWWGKLGVEEDSGLITFLFKVRDTIASIDVSKLGGKALDTLKGMGAALAGVNFSRISEGLRAFGQSAGDSSVWLDSLKIGATLLGTVLGFLSAHMDTIIKYMPLIVAGFAAWKIAQQAQVAVEIAHLPLQAAEIASSFALASANRALAFQLSLLTGQQQAGIFATIASTASRVKDLVVLGAYQVALAAVRVFTAAVTATQWLLNAAMSANPIGLVVLALAALAVGLKLAWDHSETFRTIVIAAWDGIKAAALAVADWFTGSLVPWLQKAWDTIQGGVTVLVGKVVDGWTSIRNGVNSAWTWVRDNVFVPMGQFLLVDVPGFFASAVTGIQKAWEWIKDTVRKPLDSLRDNVFMPYFTFWTVTVPGWFDSAVSGIGKAWDWIKDTIRKPIDWVRTNLFEPWYTALTVALPGYFTQAKDNIGQKWDAVKGKISDVINWVRDNIFTPWSTMLTVTVPGYFSTAVEAIGNAWDQVKNKAKEPVRFVIDTVLNDGIISAFNAIAGKFGVGSIPRIALPKGFAQGTEDHRAQIAHPGQMRVWAEPETGGEAYIPLAAAKRSRSTSILSAVADRFGYQLTPFADGGIVGLGHWFQKLGARVTEHPAFGGVHPVHKGKGHYEGRAIDVNFGPGGQNPTEMAFFDKYAQQVRDMGFKVLWRVAGHFNHLHAESPTQGFLGRITDAIGGAVSSVADFLNPFDDLTSKLKNSVLDTGFGQLVSGAASNLLGKVKDWVSDKASSLLSFGGSDSDAVGEWDGKRGKLSPADARSAGRSLLPPGWSWDALNSLWTKESGWRWDADNPSSSAYGIPQALPGSKMRSAGADWLTNAITQIQWGLDYIRGRYGTSQAAWAHSQKLNWYAAGTRSTLPGLAMVGERGPELVSFGGGQRVFNAGDTEQMLRRPVEKHLHYHAATGRSMPEEDFFDAAGRARMLGW